MELSLRTVIRDIWNNWTYTGTVFENEKFIPVIGTPFCRVVVMQGQAQIMSIGPTSLDRFTGLLYVQIFVPLGEGDERPKFLADKAREMFRKKHIGKIRFELPFDNVIGDNGEGWYLINVVVPYIVDEETSSSIIR